METTTKRPIGMAPVTPPPTPPRAPAVPGPSPVSAAASALGKRAAGVPKTFSAEELERRRAQMVGINEGKRKVAVARGTVRKVAVASGKVARRPFLK